MIGLDQYEMIRTAHRVYGKKIRELAREYGHHRNTIRKILAGVPPEYRRTKEPAHPVMDGYAAVIDAWLEKDRSAPKKQRHTAKRIFVRLKAEYGFTGSSSTVRHFVRERKAALGLGRTEAAIPLDPEAAREAEVDWGTAQVFMAGEPMRVKLFCMRSRFSGKIFVRAYPGERQEMFFDGHIAAFLFFGGVFPVIVYDNLKTAIKVVFRGRRRIEQEKFIQFRAFYTFESRFCNKAAGNEKGGVEGLVKDSRRNFLVPIPSFENFDELNRHLLEQCMLNDSGVTEGRDDRRTIGEKHEEERARLLPLPRSEYENVKLVPAGVDKYQLARVDRNKYSVPTRYVGRKIKVHVGAWTVELYDGLSLIAAHARKFGAGGWGIDPMHYLDLIGQRIASFDSARPIREWRKAWPAGYEELLRRLIDRLGDTKGKREFVAILQLHREHDAADIEAAVKDSLACGALGAGAVTHLLQAGSRPRISWSKLPADLIPGVTDHPAVTTDIARYDALLERGAA